MERSHLTGRHRWRAPEGPLLPRPDRSAREKRLAAVLLLVTALSIVIVHRYHHAPLLEFDGWLSSGVFAVSLLTILGVHEYGHHVVARRHGMSISLPIFLPAPFFVGTLGAILRVHDRPRSRTALLQMGASGPIAGFLVLTALWLSRLWLFGPLPQTGEPLTRPLLWWLLAAPLPGPVPALTTDDPVAYACWVGALVTALNLLPFGQLDGGHIISAIAPNYARQIGWGVCASLVALGFLWPGWWAWLLAIYLLAPKSPSQHPPATFIGRGRTKHPREVGRTTRGVPPQRGALVAAAVWLVWVVCFTPIPW